MTNDNQKGSKEKSQDNKPERKYKSLNSKNIFHRKLNIRLMIKYNGKFYVYITSTWQIE